MDVLIDRNLGEGRLTYGLPVSPLNGARPRGHISGEGGYAITLPTPAIMHGLSEADFHAHLFNHAWGCMGMGLEGVTKEQGEVGYTCVAI